LGSCHGLGSTTRNGPQVTPTDPDRDFWVQLGWWLGLSIVILASLAKYVFWAAVLLVVYLLFT
jgi:hypothetical protein